MKTNRIKFATVLGIVAVSLLVMSAAGQCTWEVTFPELENPTGTVTNAYDGTGVGDASLTLTYVSGAPEDEAPDQAFTGTTASDGSYTISSAVPYGKYNLKAEKEGFVFIDETVDISAGVDALPTVIGFPYNPDRDELTVSIIALWDAGFDNVEAHLTYPGGFDSADKWNGQAADNQFSSPYDNVATIIDDDGTPPGAGFFPDDVDDTGRAKLSPTGKRTSDATVTDIEGPDVDDNRDAVEITLRDSNGSGPETVAIRTVPVEWFNNFPTYNITPDANNLLPEGSDYAWIGVMKYYVHGKSGNLMTEGQSAAEGGADLTIYMVQGDTVLGKYRLPEFTTIDAASVMRINLFAGKDANAEEFSFMQIVPDVQILEGVDQNEDITPASAGDGPSVFNVRMSD